DLPAGAPAPAVAVPGELTVVRKPHGSDPRGKGSRKARYAALVSASLVLGGSAGCTWDQLDPFTPAPPPGPAETLVLHGDGVEPHRTPADAKWSADLAGAHEFYRLGEFEKAEKLFHRVAENTKNPPSVAEEARYHEAESVRRQGRLPKAADL